MRIRYPRWFLEIIACKFDTKRFSSNQLSCRQMSLIRTGLQSANGAQAEITNIM